VGYSAHTWLRIEEGEVPVMGRATLHASPNPSRVPLFAAPVAQEPPTATELRRAVIHGYLAGLNDSTRSYHQAEACAELEADLYLSHYTAPVEDTRTVAEIRQAVEEVRPPRMYTTGTEWLADLMSERASACAAILAHLGLEEKI
jgi:hypothetical protein